MHRPRLLCDAVLPPGNATRPLRRVGRGRRPEAGLREEVGSRRVCRGFPCCVDQGPQGPRLDSRVIPHGRQAGSKQVASMEYGAPWPPNDHHAGPTCLGGPHLGAPGPWCQGPELPGPLGPGLSARAPPRKTQAQPLTPEQRTTPRFTGKTHLCRTRHKKSHVWDKDEKGLFTAPDPLPALTGYVSATLPGRGEPHGQSPPMSFREQPPFPFPSHLHKTQEDAGNTHGSGSCSGSRGPGDSRDHPRATGGGLQ